MIAPSHSCFLTLSSFSGSTTAPEELCTVPSFIQPHSFSPISPVFFSVVLSRALKASQPRGKSSDFKLDATGTA